MKNWFAFYIFALIGLLGYWLIGLFSLAFAQATYPIQELGNCRDAKECYLHCEIPENSPACWSYGKYVLHKQVLAASDDNLAKKYNIAFPITQLGNCANVTQCKAYCAIAANHDACTNFAKTHGLTKETRPDEAKKQAILEKAKSELGCDSFEACKTFCEQNYQRCREFIKRNSVGGEGREHRKTGPGGCDSESSCKAYCQANPNECPGYATTGGEEYRGPHPAPGSYLGPGGCKTEAECKAYCQAHPSACPGFQPESNHQQSYPTPPAGGYPQPTYTYEQPQSYPTYSPEQYQQYQTPQTYPTYEPQPTP